MVSHVVRDAVLERDGFKCTECGCRGTKNNPLQMHHIKYRCFGGVAVAENLKTLCCMCHRNLHRHDPPFRQHKRNRKTMRRERRRRCGRGR